MQSYSEYSNDTVSLIRKHPRVDWDAFVSDYNKAHPEDYPELYQLFLAVARGRCRHLFLPSRDFCDWLVDCAGKPDANHVEIVSELNRSKPCMCHFPTESKLPSFVFWVTDKSCIGHIAISSFSSHNSHILNGESHTLAFFSKETYVAHPELNDSKFEAPKNYFSKLLSALGMYVSCFPETVIDGVPTDLRHPSHHRYLDVSTISISEKVTCSSGGTHSSPVGHLRHGHFRVLRSEKFTNKRWSVVWVRDCFVNGESITVLSPEELVEV